MVAALYLIPVPLGNVSPKHVLPVYNCEIIEHIHCFIVENVRSARRFLKNVIPSIDIDAQTFYVLNTHTSPDEIATFLQPLADGQSIGVISEAGCPAVADPGADVVALAQKRNYRVVPLVGPSAILLALMASGCNGQQFAFNGYLPIDAAERINALKTLEQKAWNHNQTQLFIETPFRNNNMLADILRTCRPQTRLCIAANITCADEFIKTQTIREWKKQLPDLNKKPCIFVLYK